MKRLTFAAALLAALVLPTLVVAASDSGNNQDVTFTIDKAIEADPAATIALGSAAPTGSSNVNADSGQTSVATLRSNAAWTATIVASSATMGENDERSSGSLGNALLYGATSTPTNAVPTTATQAATGSRNTNNNVQSYSLYFRQPISWADEAGAYTTQLTHSLSN